MEEHVPFASRSYGLFLALLLISRGMDVLSTRVATPNLVLEGNPIAKFLGWRWGILLNLVVCFGVAFWPFTAIALTTLSTLVAARNFQYAWLMRSMGEEVYRDWHVARVQETRITLFLFCLAGNTLLTGSVGGALVLFSSQQMVPFAIGMGMIAYAVAVVFYTLLAVWRLRRATERETRTMEVVQSILANGKASAKTELTEAWEREDVRASDKPGWK